MEVYTNDQIMKGSRAVLEVGKVYPLHSSFLGSWFRVVCNLQSDDWSSYNAEMINVKSGWAFTAHGTNLYPDGSIDWDFSTNGRFVEEGGCRK